MKKRMLFVGLGGLLGAILRYQIAELPNLMVLNEVNYQIMIANIIGCFILSFITRLVIDIKIPNWFKLFIATGFCGALTTFSSLCKELVRILALKEVNTFIVYLLLSIALGIFAIILGELVADKVVKKTVLKEAQ